jgi:hypothetical protein
MIPGLPKNYCAWTFLSTYYHGRSPVAQVTFDKTQAAHQRSKEKGDGDASYSGKRRRASGTKLQ